jgi:hypothetical protein
MSRLWERSCVENKVRVLYNDNTFKKNADGQGNAMACYKDKDNANDNEVVPNKEMYRILTSTRSRLPLYQ